MCFYKGKKVNLDNNDALVKIVSIEKGVSECQGLNKALKMRFNVAQYQIRQKWK